MKEIFKSIIDNKVWRGGRGETICGSGSTLHFTASLRSALEDFFIQAKIASILDAPCGDFNWFNAVSMPNVNYIGMDIIDSLISDNIKKYDHPARKFICGDICSDPLPIADIMICRDCLMHLPFSNCMDFFINFKKSGIPFLFLTSHANFKNVDLPAPGGYREINFFLPPFNFYNPLVLLDDFIPGAKRKKYLILFKRENVKDCNTPLTCPQQ